MTSGKSLIFHLLHLGSVLSMSVMIRPPTWQATPLGLRDVVYKLTSVMGKPPNTGQDIWSQCSCPLFSDSSVNISSVYMTNNTI